MKRKNNTKIKRGQRIDNALDMAHNGSFDGGHHKMWVIDQMVRALCGGELDENKEFTSTEKYEAFVKEHCDGVDGPDTYGWDTGIAP